MASVLGAFRVVFRTSGFAKSYVSTVSNNPFVVTSGAASAFFATTATFPIAYTAPNSVAFFATTSNQPIVKTAGQAVAFVVTPNPNIPKELILKIGTLEFDASGLFVDVPDATGEYVAVTNTGGYNPEADTTNPYRPKRSQVNLWTVYRIWDVVGYGDKTQTPDSQAEQNDVDYVYPLYFPTEVVASEDVPIDGIYEIILIAAPLGEDYTNDWLGNTNLYDIADQYPDWYVTSVGVMVDQQVLNCLNRRRYEFLQGVMCGKCDGDYLLLYSDYVGMLAAMEIQDWPTAIDLYNRLKNQCSGDLNSSCGC